VTSKNLNYAGGLKVFKHNILALIIHLLLGLLIAGCEAGEPGSVSDTAPPAPATATRAPTVTLKPTAHPTISISLPPLKVPKLDIEIPRLSEEQEIEIGREVGRELEKRYGLNLDNSANQRLTRIGSQIAAVSERPHLPYTFKLLNTPEINAFAVPGGGVYVTVGMLRFVQSDDELAGVIGHEVAHIARKHGAHQIEALALAQAAAEALAKRKEELQDIYRDERARLAAKFAATLVLRGWGRHNELEADEAGTIYAARAGYDPRAVITLLRRLQSFEGSDDSRLDSLFATHPPTAERIKRVEEVIEREGLVR